MGAVCAHLPEHCCSAHKSTRLLASGSETRREGLNPWCRSTCLLLKDQGLEDHNPHHDPNTSEEEVASVILLNQLQAQGKSCSLTAVASGGLSTIPPWPGHSVAPWVSQVRCDAWQQEQTGAQSAQEVAPVSALRTRWHSGPFPLPTVSVVSSETYVLEEPPGTGLRFLRMPSYRGIPYILGSQGLGGWEGGGYEQGKRLRRAACSEACDRPCQVTPAMPTILNQPQTLTSKLIKPPDHRLCSVSRAGSCAELLAGVESALDCGHGPAVASTGDWVCAGNGSDGALHLPRAGVVS